MRDHPPPLRTHLQADNLGSVRKGRASWLQYEYIKMFGQGYTGTGIETVTTPPLVGSMETNGSFSKQSQHLHLIKFGVNYHFSQTPVVVSARY